MREGIDSLVYLCLMSHVGEGYKSINRLVNTRVKFEMGVKI